MKRILAVMLAVLLVLCLCACGGSDTNSPAAPAPEAAPEQPAAPDTQPESPAPQETETEPAEVPAPSEPVDGEVVLIDNDECTITATGLEYDKWSGYSLNVRLENKSSAVTYRFDLDGAAVNGVDTAGILYECVAPGKIANSSVSIMDSALVEAVPEVTDIELLFNVHDDNDYSADSVVTEPVHYYPYGEGAASVYVRAPQPTDTVLVDNDQITVVVTGYEADDYFYSVNLYIENKTDTRLMFTADDTSVNDIMCDPHWAETVAANKVRFSQMDWVVIDLTDNKITEVKNIEMTLRAYDYDDWSADDIYKEVVTLNP